MARKFSQFTDGLTGQSPTDTLVGLDVSLSAAAQNSYWTLNNLFAVITRNITDGTLRFGGFAAPALSAAGQGSLYFDSSSNTFKISQNGGAYANLLSGTVTVPQGGTGLTTLTAYALMAGGTTSTGNVQQVSGVGSAGQILTSNGAGALPTWQNVAAGGGISAAVVGNLIVANSIASGTDSGIVSTRAANSVSSRKNVLDYASLAAAVASIGSSTPTTLVIPTSTSVAASLTITANITLEFTNTGALSVAAAQTVTIQGAINAPPRQIFSGSGLVRFILNVSIPAYYVQWWGALGNGTTDDTAAIQAAIDAVPTSSAVLRSVPNADHPISSTLTILDRHSWQFGAEDFLPTGPRLTWTSAGGGTLLNVLDCTQVLIKGWSIIVASTKLLDRAIVIDRSAATSSQVWIHNCYINTDLQRNANYIAIDIAPSGANNNENMQIVNCIIVPSGQGPLLKGDTGAMTATSTTLTFGSAIFSAGDVGKTIQVSRVGTAGATLTTTIASFTSPTQVELTDPAITTATNARVILGQGYGIGVRNGQNPNHKHQIIKDCGISQAYKAVEVRAGSVEVYNLGGSACNYGIYYGAGVNTEPNIIEQLVAENYVCEIFCTSFGIFDFRDLRGSNSSMLPEGFWQLAGHVNLSNSACEIRSVLDGKLISFTTGGTELTLDNFAPLVSGGRIACWNDIFGSDELLSTQIRVVGATGISGWPTMGLQKGRNIDASQIQFSTADWMWMPAAGCLTDQNYVNPAYALYNVTSRNTLIYGDDEIEITGLFRPNAPAVRPVGTLGATTYELAVVAVDSAGQRSLRSLSTTTSFANATLSASNYIRVNWPKVQNAATYELYRINPSNIEEAILIASGIATNSYNIVTNPGTGYAAWTTLVPAYNQASIIKYRARTAFPLEGTFADGDTTPSVKSLSDYVTANTGATSITTFDDSTEGQILRVRVADANTTFVNGATLVTGTGGNIAAVNGKVYQFILRASAWRLI